MKRGGKDIESLDSLRVLSLFSGCGGMDLGFEGDFICHRKSISPQNTWVQEVIDEHWVRLQKNRFRTVFANDILKEAQTAWLQYMDRFGYDKNVYNTKSIVDLVKEHRAGKKVFPKNIDVVTGGFPCQDFSVSGKRLGFESNKDHTGKLREDDEASEETRGKLYYWMKQVIDITRPKIFIAENVKGLVNLGDVKSIIQRDFAHAAGDGYIVLDPQVLHAGNYGVPESRERVIFIGIRKSALKVKALRALQEEKIPKAYDPYPSPTHACTVEDKKQEKRRALLDAAYELFLERGTAKTSVEDITSRAKVAKGTFYLYFQDKGAVMQALLGRVSYQLLNNACEAVERQTGLETFPDKMVAVIDHIIEALRRDTVVLKFLERNFVWPGLDQIEASRDAEPLMRKLLNVVLASPEMAGRTEREVYQRITALGSMCMSVCYSSILEGKPDNIDSMKPVLYDIIRKAL